MVCCGFTSRLSRKKIVKKISVVYQNLKKKFSRNAVINLYIILIFFCGVLDQRETIGLWPFCHKFFLYHLPAITSTSILFLISLLFPKIFLSFLLDNTVNYSTSAIFKKTCLKFYVGYSYFVSECSKLLKSQDRLVQKN